MTRSTSARLYECNICGSETEVYRYPDREATIGICTDCWFGVLAGSERKAIAERVMADD